MLITNDEIEASADKRQKDKLKGLIASLGQESAVKIPQKNTPRRKSPQEILDAKQSAEKKLYNKYIESVRKFKEMIRKKNE